MFARLMLTLKVRCKTYDKERGYDIFFSFEPLAASVRTSGVIANSTFPTPVICRRRTCQFRDASDVGVPFLTKSGPPAPCWSVPKVSPDAVLFTATGAV
jgi:hypothetical protein